MIRIVNSSEFGKLITTLSSDVVDAHIHWRLYCDLHDAIQAQSIVWSQSRTFWHLTLSAHAETAVMHLCRVFDQEQSALHLLSWLKIIQANLQIFEAEKFKIRLAGNAFVDSLAQDIRRPDTATLDADIAGCSDSDVLVKKLMVHRNNVVAHQSAKLAVSSKELPIELALTVEDLEALLSRAHTVLNRYCHLFSAETYSVSMIGRDDFKFIFSSVVSAVERSRNNNNI